MEEGVFGIICLTDSNQVPYYFFNGKITLFCGVQGCSYDEDTSDLIGCVLPSNEWRLYHLSFPLKTISSAQLAGEKVLLGNVTLDIDYYISQYKAGVLYNKLSFNFKELDCFIPSCGALLLQKSENKYIISQTSNEILRFNFQFLNKDVAFVLEVTSQHNLSDKINFETYSQLILEFDYTTDFEFIVKLYHLVKNFFAFICNRRNISFSQATLSGKYVTSIPFNTEAGTISTQQKTCLVSSIINVVDRFGYDWEDEKSINENVAYAYLHSNFQNLFQLMLEDKISIASIHACNSLKKLIDLNQSLHMTATFENYQRTLLPSISSPTTVLFYDAIKNLIDTYANQHTGKQKKKAQDLSKALSPQLSLEEKIKKVYNGYKGWTGLKNILDEWFKGKVDKLAKVANEWRNELAHEKNEFEPTRDVIDAVRLVEHINYCIILRTAGYTDIQIKNYLEILLLR